MFDIEISQEIKNHLFNNLRVDYQINKAFNYVSALLQKKNNILNLNSPNNVDFHKKKYNRYLFLKSDDWEFIFRFYDQHITIFCRKEYLDEYNGMFIRREYDMKIMTIQIINEWETSNLNDWDIFLNLLENLLNGGLNNITSDILKSDFHQMNVVSTSNTSIHSFDDYIFAFEELKLLYTEMYAENALIETLRNLRVEQYLNDRWKILEIKLPVGDKLSWENGFWYGLLLLNLTTNENKFVNIYSLVKWDKLFEYGLLSEKS